jgi:radical SAM superfamily enzyme YgiQ (UPF0313 family)
MAAFRGCVMSEQPLKIALVMSPCWGRESPPLSIALLGSNLRRKGFDVKLFDLSNHFYHKVPTEQKKLWGQEHYSYWSSRELLRRFFSDYDQEIETIVNTILNTGAKVIGFSLYFTTLYFSLELARRIKLASPESLIIMGGPQTSLYSSGMVIIEDPNVDAIVLHEGDETLPLMLHDFQERGELLKIPGLIFKKNGVIVDGGMREPIPDLDSIYFPDYDDFELVTYADPRRLDIFSSRSCINLCHYCNERNYFSKYRFRSGRNIFQEVKYQLERFPQVAFFNFSDSVLNGAMEAVDEFCHLLIDNNIKIKWGGQAVIRKEMTLDRLKFMRKAGCSYLSFGVESGSDSVLKSMNKTRFDAKLASEVLKATHLSGINTYANFMFGYPTETDHDFQKTIDFIQQNRRWLDGVSPSQSFTVIVKNTYLYDHADKFGVESCPHHLYWKTADGKNTYPIRFERYERFCRFCLDLGLSGVGLVREKIDKWQLLGEYYFEHEKDYHKALDCYQNDLKKNKNSQSSRDRISECCKILGRG